MPSNNDFINSLTASGGLNNNRGRFASPWVDLASQYAPRTFKDALTLCEYLYLNNSTYRKSSERIVGYFLTKINLSGQSDKEIEKFEKIMNDKFGIMERLKEMGESYMIYGNSFSAIIPPFIRLLKCVNCRNWTNIKEVNFEFKPGEGNYYARCRCCKKTGRHLFKDFPNPDPSKIRMVNLDPKRITIEHNPISGDSNYWLDIDQHMQNKIMGGDQFMVSTTPSSFITAITQKKKYKFKPEYIYHMKEGSVAGIPIYGWGMPSILSSFKNFFRLQVLLRYDEVMMMDYIVPIRILSPANPTLSSAGNSLLEIASINNFTNHMSSAVARHRVDGADWNFLPFPVNYQAIGGEGRDLVSKELIKEEEDRLLNARGMPPQLYRGDLQLQVAPTALRLFERTHSTLVSGLNGATQWMVTNLARLIKSGDIDACVESVTLSDDMEAKQLRLQLMQAQLISRETGLGPIGINAREEKQRLMEELKEDQRTEQRAQKELEMEQMSLDTQEGDAQGTGDGGAGGASPVDVAAQGADIARQLLDPSVTETARRQQLTQYRQSNPTLHAVIIKELEKLRNQAGLLGRDAGMQQVLSQGKTASMEIGGLSMIEPDLRSREQFMDSMRDYRLVYGRWPRTLFLTKEAADLSDEPWPGVDIVLEAEVVDFQ